MTIKEAFEALSDTCAKGMKNPFFVMRRLKDSFADVADKVVDDVYSTDEHVVGKWIDGSNLYERVINVGALPNNTLKTIEIPTGLKIVSLIGTAINPTNGVTLTIPYVSLGGAIGSVNVSASNGVISITTDTNREPFSDTKIIIKYIKSTT